MVKTWAFTAVDPNSIPGLGAEIPQAVRCGQKKKKKSQVLFNSLNFTYMYIMFSSSLVGPALGFGSLQWKKRLR